MSSDDPPEEGEEREDQQAATTTTATNGDAAIIASAASSASNGSAHPTHTSSSSIVTAAAGAAGSGAAGAAATGGDPFQAEGEQSSRRGSIEEARKRRGSRHAFTSLSSAQLRHRRGSLPAYPAGVKTPAAIVEWAVATSREASGRSGGGASSAPSSRPSSAGSAVGGAAAAPRGLLLPTVRRSGSWSSNGSDTSEFLTEEEVEEELSCLSSMAGDPPHNRYGPDAAAHLLNSPLTHVSLHQAEVTPEEVASADAIAMAAAAAAAGGAAGVGDYRRSAKRRSSATLLAPSGQSGISPSSGGSDASYELAPSYETMMAAMRAGVNLEPIYPLASKQRRETASQAAKRAHRIEEAGEWNYDHEAAAAAALAASRLKVRERESDVGF